MNSTLAVFATKLPGAKLDITAKGRVLRLTIRAHCAGDAEGAERVPFALNASRSVYIRLFSSGAGFADGLAGICRFALLCAGLARQDPNAHVANNALHTL
jgi:hypothetical protein